MAEITKGPEVRIGDIGSAPIIPITLVIIGGYLAWFGVKYFRSDVTWPSDPVKAVLQGKKPPSKGPVQTSSTILTATEINVSSASGGSGGGTSRVQGKAAVPTGPGERAFWIAVLATLGAPPTEANIKSLSAWSAREAPWNGHPPDGAAYTHNPLNTTLGGYGETGNVNSVGVKIYPNARAGVAATAATLRGYPRIYMALKSGQGVCGSQFSSEFSKWSGGGYTSIC